MATIPPPIPPRPRPLYSSPQIRFNPDDSHPVINELCLRKRDTHSRGEHEHIDFHPAARRLSAPASSGRQRYPEREGAPLQPRSAFSSPDWTRASPLDR